MMVAQILEERLMSEKKQRRSWTPDEKAEIVLAGLRGDRSVRDVCREHEISETLFYQWRDRLLEGGRAALRRPDEKRPEDEALKEARKRIAHLERALGRKTYELEVAGDTVTLDELRRWLETTPAALDERLFLCRSLDRDNGRIDRGEGLLLVLAVRLRQRGVRRPVVSRAIAALLAMSESPLTGDWVAVKRTRTKDVSFHLLDAVDLTAIRADASAVVFTAAELRALNDRV